VAGHTTACRPAPKSDALLLHPRGRPHTDGRAKRAGVRFDKIGCEKILHHNSRYPVAGLDPWAPTPCRTDEAHGLKTWMPGSSPAKGFSSGVNTSQKGSKRALETEPDSRMTSAAMTEVGGGADQPVRIMLQVRAPAGRDQAASTITISESSSAVTVRVGAFSTAAPSRAPMCTPFTSTRPLAGTKYACRPAPSRYSTR
jgi:hypothetical protein